MKSIRNAGDKTVNRHLDGALALLDGAGVMARKKDPELEALFGALCVAVGCEPKMPRSQATIYWMKAHELKDIDATPEQVHTVARGIRASGWGKDNPSAVTPRSIAGHWTEFVGGTAEDKRRVAEKHRAECVARVKTIPRSELEAAVSLYKSKYPHALMDIYYLLNPVGDDDERHCVSICKIVDDVGDRNCRLPDESET